MDGRAYALPMGNRIDDLTARQKFDLQAYLALITREFGCLGVGRPGVSQPQRSGTPVVSFEKRWAALRAKVEYAEVSKLVEELIDEVRDAGAA